MALQPLDQVISGQALPPAINDNGEAARPATLFGRRRSTTVGLTWGYYGGPTMQGGNVVMVPHGTVTLTANATNYVQADPASFALTVNTTGFTASKIPVRRLVTNANTITTDECNLSFAFVSASATGSGTVTSVNADGGVETDTGNAITSTGSVHAAIGLRLNTTTSYAVVTADRARLLSFTNAGAVAVSLPQAGTTGFPAKWFFFFQNRGAGTVTITPTTSTIDGATSLVVPAGTGGMIVSDGTNYFSFNWVSVTASGGSSTAGITVSAKTGNYTLVLADANTAIYHPPTDTTARVWTIPANASVPFPIGTAVTFDNDLGAGSISIQITSDTLVVVGPAGSTGNKTLASGGQATALKVAATRWRISGTGLS